MASSKKGLPRAPPVMDPGGFGHLSAPFAPGPSELKHTRPAVLIMLIRLAITQRGRGRAASH